MQYKGYSSTPTMTYLRSTPLASRSLIILNHTQTQVVLNPLVEERGPRTSIMNIEAPRPSHLYATFRSCPNIKKPIVLYNYIYRIRFIAT